MLEQVQALAEDFEFHIYSSRIDDLDLEKVVWHRVPAIPGPLLARFAWFFCANHVARWLDQTFRSLRIDLVYSPGINCFDADLTVVHILFAEFRERTKENLRFVKNPLRFWFRLLHRRLYYGLIIFLERRVYRRPNLVLVAVARKLSVALDRFYGRSRVAILYSGVDCDRFNHQTRQKIRAAARKTMGYSETNLVVLLIGNDWINKGLACLLKAAALIQNTYLKIAVVGKDDESPFHVLASSERLGSSVQFFPVRPDPEFYYAAADIYAGPSLEDAFALPPLEAMACGLPAIVSRRAGVSELVTHGQDGYILEDPESPEELAALIVKLQEDAVLRETVGLKAAAKARQYTWERNASQFREILLSALVAKKAVHSVRPVKTDHQAARD